MHLFRCIYNEWKYICQQIRMSNIQILMFFPCSLFPFAYFRCISSCLLCANNCNYMNQIDADVCVFFFFCWNVTQNEQTHSICREILFVCCILNTINCERSLPFKVVSSIELLGILILSNFLAAVATAAAKKAQN